MPAESSGNQSDMRKQIRDFVLRDLAESRGITVSADDASLVESGVVDSLGIFQLVSFLEDTFRIRISDEEIVPDNFRTLDDIAAFVGAKRGDRGVDT